MNVLRLPALPGKAPFNPSSWSLRQGSLKGVHFIVLININDKTKSVWAAYP